jgi:protein-L-isoaspartate(D-aspartate) O-methyltransferase
VIDPRAAREAMVRDQIVARGVTDPRVLKAMGKVPREQFVNPDMKDQAYEDRALQIGKGQTISQPYVVARMCELAAIQATDRVLEVGAGCGYQTAVLAELASDVFGVEIIPELYKRARATLDRLRIANARVENFDGTHGWPEHAPYDAILVAAGGPRVPVLLLAQLADGGRLVIPVGPRDGQRLVVVTRMGDEFDTRYDIPVQFVDLTGTYGWGGHGPGQA